ncbi:hypothetical protein Drorol1_Dr00016525, partial [Drosera rotundifolia]
IAAMAATWRRNATSRLRNSKRGVRRGEKDAADLREMRLMGNRSTVWVGASGLVIFELLVGVKERVGGGEWYQLVVVGEALTNLGPRGLGKLLSNV